MDLKDFTDLGKDIGRRVNSAIYNMNFDQLNRDIRNKVDQAFGTGSAGDFGGLNGKLYHGEEEERQQTYAHRSAADKKTGSSCPFGIPIMEKIPGKISGMAMMIIGYSVAAIFALTGSILGITGLDVYKRQRHIFAGDNFNGMAAIIGVAVDSIHNKTVYIRKGKQTAGTASFIRTSPFSSDDRKVFKLFIGCTEDDIAFFFSDHSSAFCNNRRIISRAQSSAERNFRTLWDNHRFFLVS